MYQCVKINPHFSLLGWAKFKLEPNLLQSKATPYKTAFRLVEFFFPGTSVAQNYQAES
jgi:hypothetical protein